MRFPPPEVIASWPAPDYKHPRGLGPAGEIVVYVLTAIVTVMIAIRMYTRIHVARGFGMDDGFILAAYIFATGFTGIAIMAEQMVGWGVHIYDVEPSKFKYGLQIVMIAVNLFNFASGFTKLSILSTLWKLLGASRPRLKVFVAVCGVLISLNSVIFCLVVVFQCRPISNYWNVMAEPRNCLDEAAHLLAAGIINTFTDFVVVLLPIITVMKLQLTTRNRLVVVGLFSLGFLACGVGAFRTYITWHMTVDYDLTYHAGSVFWSSAVELNTGIICASVPATKPFFTRHLPQALGLTAPPTTQYLTSFGPCSNPRMSGFTLTKQPDTRAATAAQANASANAVALANNSSNINCHNSLNNHHDNNNSNNSRLNISNTNTGETAHHRAEQSISTLWLDLERPSSIPDGYPLSRKSSETLPTASGPTSPGRWSWSRLSSPRAPRVEEKEDQINNEKGEGKGKTPRLTSWLGDESRPGSRDSEDDRYISDVESGDFRVVKGLDERVKSFASSDRVRMV
ncbi:hypothetical protein PG996_014415 [Apiospora saccharicola]|uniref:Rhodopsin domain-containing protein n=1 Tax=Apiospora saccharicola TaxID=335842 RepID=A0ABR1TI84_9PEZI